MKAGTVDATSLLEQLRDPYERKARIFPALLTALPLLVPLLWIFGPKNPLLTALLGLVASCGVIYALASMARGKGKHLEKRLVEQWGGLPTTLILRHRDTFLDAYSKKRYHDLFRTKLGIVLPDAQQEEADPAAADALYLGATRELRELARGRNHTLLLKENIAYGFHRNMLAMRPLGVLTCTLGMMMGLVLGNILVLVPPSINFARLALPGMSAGMTLFVSISLLIAWAHFGKNQVKQMGYVYAERLFECMTALPTKRRAPTR